jgi:hypothetical protein
MQFIDDLHRATVQARERTGDKTLGVTVKQGRFQVVSVTYPKPPRSVVTPLTDWVSAAEAARFLDARR